MKPLIGLTPTPELKDMEHGTFRLHTLSDYYSKAVEAAGGIPVVLPAHYQYVEEMLDRLDGVIVTGGGDIAPERYGQQVYEKTAGIDNERDTFEQEIIRAALTRDLPLLGICRGLQILNVALGGTLYQDVGDLVPAAHEHRQQSLKIHHEKLFQKAVLTPGDHPLRNLTDHDEIEINSFHHQCINELAETLRIAAQAEDGVIEAVYNPKAAYTLAVQWHPEMLASQHDFHAGIFRSLVKAATEYQSQQRA